jgi:two-component sensor histidine kinase/AmiR/NasT family two-component response regulator
MENKPIKALLIEDSLFAARHTQKMLAEAKTDQFDVELKCAGQLSVGLEHLAEGGTDIVLLDLTLPDSDELHTFTKVHSQAPDIPIVVLTGLEDEKLAIEAVKKGAQDYLVKGQVDSNLLKRSIIYAIERKQTAIELKKYRYHLEELVEKRTAEINKINKRLKKEITGHKRAEEQIRASLKEKEVLLQEVHHRVKNNMQIICSLFSLQSGHIKNKQILEMCKSSQNRVRSMAIIHERLYQSKDMARVDFADYVQSLSSHLLSSHRINPEAVKLRLKIKDVFLDLNTAIPCGLIINELVSNSLKHAFPEENNGEIKIAMHPLNKDGMEIIISDNGIGLPKNMDIRKTDSLGLHLVNLLAEDQLHGDIKLDRTRGTSFHIRFKVKQ